jgi:hypothetical protein
MAARETIALKAIKIYLSWLTGFPLSSSAIYAVRITFRLFTTFGRA